MNASVKTAEVFRKADDVDIGNPLINLMLVQKVALVSCGLPSRLL
jgi:hypothetical protein